MKLSAHRGFWLTPQEKNSVAAFERALQAGFGIETDLRDAGGAVLIAHDLPRGDELTLDAFLALCARYPQSRPLALNIKADGQQALVKAALQRHAIEDAFVFDMAVPDALGYLRAGLTTYTRASEYELAPSFLQQAHGIWVDAFHDLWYQRATLEPWLAQGKQLSIVSPELHGRPHLPLWQLLRDWGLHRHPGVSLCTDFPQIAKEFFDAQD